MAIRDLLWACPLCGREGGLRPAGPGRERCAACGAEFRRASGADIAARTADGSLVLPAQTWALRLPAIRAVGAAAQREGEGEGEGRAAPAARRAEVQIRSALGEAPIRIGGRYLGAAERLGPRRPAILVLSADTLGLETTGQGRRTWSLAAVTALQPTSGVLQIRLAGEPLLTIRFLRESVRFWEELLQRTIEAFHAAAGRCVLEFQPRITLA
jgi:hypothetical protein